MKTGDQEEYLCILLLMKITRHHQIVVGGKKEVWSSRSDAALALRDHTKCTNNKRKNNNDKIGFALS